MWLLWQALEILVNLYSDFSNEALHWVATSIWLALFSQNSRFHFVQQVGVPWPLDVAARLLQQLVFFVHLLVYDTLAGVLSYLPSLILARVIFGLDIRLDWDSFLWVEWSFRPSYYPVNHTFAQGRQSLISLFTIARASDWLLYHLPLNVYVGT